MQKVNLILSHDERFNFIGVVFDRDGQIQTNHKGQVRGGAEVPFADTGNRKVYYYKTVDETFKPGDTCIVNTPSTGYCVALVVEVDAINRVGDYQYKWVVQKIDDTAYLEHNKIEEQVIEKINEVERSKIRKEFKEQMVLAIGEDGVKEINKLVKL